jgi:light-regulated signal transduction histidine kinase (bacteriophytochrome)
MSQYMINKMRVLFDRDQPTSRLLGCALSDMAVPLDLTHSYLRALSPIHLKYLKNMGVISSMSVSLKDSGSSKSRLWGLVVCHSYGKTATRVPFRIRELCYFVGLTASMFLSNLLSAKRLNAATIMKTIKPDQKLEEHIIASPDELLRLFDADFGFLVVNGEAKTIGKMASYNESLVLLHYLRFRQSPDILSTDSIQRDFRDLKHDFEFVAGVLFIPLSLTNLDFVAFFRNDQAREVIWAGRPSKKFEGGSLEPRQSFAKWTEYVHGTSRDWSVEQRMLWS